MSILCFRFSRAVLPPFSFEKSGILRADKGVSGYFRGEGKRAKPQREGTLFAGEGERSKHSEPTCDFWLWETFPLNPKNSCWEHPKP